MRREYNASRMRAYRATERGKAASSVYNKSPAGRSRYKRFQETLKRRRYELMYNRTVRYSRSTDRFIEEQERKLVQIS